MRLDHDGIAGGEAREHAGVAVPGRESIATDDKTYTARHDPIMLLHFQRLVLALRLLPVRFLRHPAHFVVRVGDGLQTAILRMRTGRLKSHHEGLSRRMHYGVGDLEATLIYSR